MTETRLERDEVMTIITCDRKKDGFFSLIDNKDAGPFKAHQVGFIHDDLPFNFFSCCVALLFMVFNGPFGSKRNIQMSTII